MSKSFWEAVKERRSYYGFGPEKPVSEARVEEIVRDAVKYVPSAFNSKSTRVLLLFGEKHKKLWSVTLDALRKVTDDEQFAGTKAKVEGAFASGYGTVLFFEDQTVVDGLMASFPLYAANFPVWSMHTSAMHQFTVWTALEAEGLGASLQHYNPLIDDAVREAFELPASWKLVAQMPFGKPAAAPAEKDYGNDGASVRVLK